MRSGQELTVVEASYGWCPTRTLWTLDDDGLWHCACCTVVKRIEDLVDVRHVVTGSGNPDSEGEK